MKNASIKCLVLVTVLFSHAVALGQTPPSAEEDCPDADGKVSVKGFPQLRYRPSDIARLSPSDLSGLEKIANIFFEKQLVLPSGKTVPNFRAGKANEIRDSRRFESVLEETGFEWYRYTWWAGLWAISWSPQYDPMAKFAQFYMVKTPVEWLIFDIQCTHTYAKACAFRGGDSEGKEDEIVRFNQGRVKVPPSMAKEVVGEYLARNAQDNFARNFSTLVDVVAGIVPGLNSVDQFIQGNYKQGAYLAVVDLAAMTAPIAKLVVRGTSIPIGAASKLTLASIAAWKFGRVTGKLIRHNVIQPLPQEERFKILLETAEVALLTLGTRIPSEGVIQGVGTWQVRAVIKDVVKPARYAIAQSRKFGSALKALKSKRRQTPPPAPPAGTTPPVPEFKPPSQMNTLVDINLPPIEPPPVLRLGAPPTGPPALVADMLQRVPNALQRDGAMAAAKWAQIKELLPDNLRDAYDALNKIMGDRDRFMNWLAKFDQEVASALSANPTPLERFQKTFEAIRRRAAEGGWSDEILILVDDSIWAGTNGRDLWRKMLSEGKLFVDTTFFDAERAALNLGGGGDLHTASSHLYQLLYAQEELAKVTVLNGFRTTEGRNIMGELMRHMGDTPNLTRIDDTLYRLSTAGARKDESLWLAFFDSLEVKSICKPEVIGKFYHAAPNLKMAEAIAADTHFRFMASERLPPSQTLYPRGRAFPANDVGGGIGQPSMVQRLESRGIETTEELAERLSVDDFANFAGF